MFPPCPQLGLDQITSMRLWSTYFAPKRYHH